MKGKLIVIDGLDGSGKATQSSILYEKLKNSGKTLIIVTHEMAFAKDVSTRVIFMADGNIIEEGKPNEVFENPTHPRTKDFLKRYFNK